MAFVAIQRDQSAAVYASDLVQIVNQLNNLYALVERTEERMQEMDNDQIETLYGLAGYGPPVKAQIVSALTVLEEPNGALERLRTQLG